MFEDLYYGVIGGVGWSITGYVNKLRHEPDTQFSFKQFIYSGFLGATVGAVARQMGVDFETANTLFVTYGGTAILNEGLKWIWLKIQPSPIQPVQPIATPG